MAGSFSRSGVNYAAGASTPVSSAICALIIILTLLFFTGAFIDLPNAALAAIVMVSVLNLVDLRSWRRNWQIYRQDCWTEWGTALGVLGFGVELGLLFGVVLSIAFFLRTSSKPVITQIGRLGDSQQFRSAKRYPVTLHPHVLALRIDENLYFANAGQIEDRVVGRALRRRGTSHVLLACGSVNLIDSTGLAMLERMSETLADANITLNLSELKGPVAEQLRPAELNNIISGAIYFSNDEAMLELEQRDTQTARCEHDGVGSLPNPQMQWAFLVLVALSGLTLSFSLLDELNKDHANYGFNEALRFLLLTMPRRIEELMPYGIFIGLLLVLGNMAESGELTAFRAAGVSPWRLGSPCCLPC